MHAPYVCGYVHEVTRCMVVWCTQNLRRDGNSFMCHQPCQRCKYTTALDIYIYIYNALEKKRGGKKLAIRSCRITRESSESARERRIALYESDHQLHVFRPMVFCRLESEILYCVYDACLYYVRCLYCVRCQLYLYDDILHCVRCQSLKHGRTTDS